MWKNATNSAHCVDILQCIQKETSIESRSSSSFQLQRYIARQESSVCAGGNYASLTLHKCCPHTRHAYNKMHQSEVQLNIHLLTFFPDSYTPHTPRTHTFNVLIHIRVFGSFCFSTPLECPQGEVLKFYGISTTINYNYTHRCAQTQAQTHTHIHTLTRKPEYKTHVHI